MTPFQGSCSDEADDSGGRDQGLQFPQTEVSHLTPATTEMHIYIDINTNHICCNFIRKISLMCSTNVLAIDVLV